jgi:hypothetical protein
LTFQRLASKVLINLRQVHVENICVTILIAFARLVHGNRRLPLICSTTSDYVAELGAFQFLDVPCLTFADRQSLVEKLA